ncbi:glycosyltransferase 87 family protein [Albimonas sp. CAU 1670]|uniref:glycosyltransferase 87 family protein n=1 Tax=Albimonas sp. CAU 1670 TaxID=3032599 RepID=UPI0023DBAAA7|nr:glycosyltransferase 87 family protein [Albimonas sp. CAU 1670]MDF2231538.1 glycosyltransferase 87 family protein [Albimonas sp. CAU 1670]
MSGKSPNAAGGWRGRASGPAGAVALAVLWVAALLLSQAGRLADPTAELDFASLHLAARFVALGRPEMIYAFPAAEMYLGPPEAWAALAAAEGLDPGLSIFPYVYPPLWANLCAPLATALGLPGFMLLGAVVNLAALAAGALLSISLFRPAAPPAAVAAVALLGLTLLAPLTTSLMHNQPQMLVAGLTVLAIERAARGRGRGAALLAGGALALAASIKLAPAAVGLWWIARRRWGALGAAAGVGAALFALNLALGGLAQTQAWLEMLGQMSRNVFVSTGNGGLEIVLHLLSGPAAPPVQPRPGWIQAATLGALAAMLAMTVALCRPAGPADADASARVEGAGALAVLLAATICGPVMWQSYLLAPLLCLPALAWSLRRAPGGRAVAALTVAALVLHAEALLTALPALAGPLGVIVCAFLAALVTLGALWAGMRAARASGAAKLPDPSGLALRPSRAPL